jgi:hypothetical protein
MIRPSVTKSPELARFTGYRVQPVVETTASDGFEKSFQAFSTHAEAVAELKPMREQTNG